MKNNDQIRPQFCTCHDSWAVVTCAKLWPDWIITLHGRITFFLMRLGLRAHKLFVKWVPETREGMVQIRPCLWLCQSGLWSVGHITWWPLLELVLRHPVTLVESLHLSRRAGTIRPQLQISRGGLNKWYGTGVVGGPNNGHNDCVLCFIN